MSAHGRRYSAQAMTRARELSEAGWGNAEIRQLLGQEGHGTPHVTTIRSWVLPDHARERWREANRVRARKYWVANRATMLARKGATVEYQEARIRQLHGVAGLTPNMVARVMRFDFGVEWTAARVLGVLGLRGRSGGRRRALRGVEELGGGRAEGEAA